MIAEFLLRRTRAEQAATIYQAFIQKYPVVEALAYANETEIKSVTEHLGLHCRSTQLIEAAQYVVEQFDGEFPDIRRDLLKIPGIGHYTAGAILSICFNKPEHAIDSNIARFINRYHGLNLTGDIPRKKQIIHLAKELFNTKEPGTFLFAILDFTHKICKPQTPDCRHCLLKSSCQGKHTKKIEKKVH